MLSNKMNYLSKDFFFWLFTSLQGTASVVLAGLVAAQKLVGGTLADHRYLFLGAGEVGLYYPVLNN